MPKALLLFAMTTFRRIGHRGPARVGVGAVQRHGPGPGRIEGERPAAADHAADVPGHIVVIQQTATGSENDIVQQRGGRHTALQSGVAPLRVIDVPLAPRALSALKRRMPLVTVVPPA